MKINQEKIEQLLSLLNGSLKEKDKSILLEELQNNVELFDMFELLKKMDEISPQDSKSMILASKKLSQSLYRDFLKKQASPNLLYGVQVYDSTLLPLPKGVRPASVDTRLLKYQVGGVGVELTIYPITIDSVELIGQIRNIEKNQEITISAETHNKTFTTNIDEFGLFRFERIDAGDCRLMFSIENEKKSIIELTL